jgi:hypothetical protein
LPSVFSPITRKRACCNDTGRSWPPRTQHGVLTCCKSLCFWGGDSSLHVTGAAGKTARSARLPPCHQRPADPSCRS